MSNPKRIGLEGSIKAYAGCSRIIATIQRASNTELPAQSGEKRWRAVPVLIWEVLSLSVGGGIGSSSKGDLRVPDQTT
jgi:hypothetical protein